MDMSVLIIAWRVLLSVFFGALVGVEREMHGCAAGLRTHILVCVGSTLFMATSIFISIGYGHLGAVDPSRIAAGVVTGIGFLGAGAIIRYGTSIRGLTTAASIWAVAAIGLAIGAGMYGAAVVTTVVVVTVLFLSHLEEYFQLKKCERRLVIEMQSTGETGMDDIRDIIVAYGGKIKQVTLHEDKVEGMMTITINLFLSRTWCQELIQELSSSPAVKEVRWA